MLFVINTHSFVDLITNSSSELFVCDIQKTEEMIREILSTLLDQHNKLAGTSLSFDAVFGEVIACNSDFDYSSFSDQARKQWQEYKYIPGNYSSEPTRNAEKELLYKKSRELVSPVYIENPNKTQKLSYEKAWKKYRVAYDEIWKDWRNRADKAEYRLYLEFCEKNNSLPLQRGVNWGKRGTGEIDRSSEQGQALWLFNYGMSWNLKLKKGTILIFSEGDNSIPYELFDSIESYLNAQRYHLG